MFSLDHRNTPWNPKQEPPVQLVVHQGPLRDRLVQAVGGQTRLSAVSAGQRLGPGARVCGGRLASRSAREGWCVHVSHLFSCGLCV